MGHYWLMITPVPLPVPNTLNFVGLLQVCNISSVAAAEVRRLLQDVNNMVTIASFGDGYNHISILKNLIALFR